MTHRFAHQPAHGRTRSLALAVLVLLALPLLAGLATGPAAGAAKRPPTSPVPIDPARARAMRASFDSSVIDTQPSREAAQVLATIPEPLTKGEQVPPPAFPAADSAAAETDSLAAPADSTDADADSSDVPTPERGVVLGDFSTPVAIPDSVLAPVHPVAPTGGSGAVGVPATAAAATPPDSCWGVQIAAPTEEGRAETIRAAAQSLLLIPMKVDAAGGRFRVQTRECVSAEVAEKLRVRAIDSGFDGAFRIVGGTAVPPPARPAGSAGKKPRAK